MTTTPRAAKTQRQEHDHYGTPAWCTRALLRAVPEIRGARCIEPCAGTSRIASVLREAGCEVFTSDLVAPPEQPLAPWPKLDILQDLTEPDAVSKLAPHGPWEWCVTNPPYQILPQILPALMSLAPSGALL